MQFELWLMTLNMISIKKRLILVGWKTIGRLLPRHERLLPNLWSFTTTLEDMKWEW